MDNKELRRINLERVIEKAGGSAKLAVMVGTAPAYLSQIMNPQHRANVGDKLARRIESAMGLPTSWMDKEHSDSPTLEREGMLLEMFRCLDEEQQVEVLRSVEETKRRNDKIAEHYRKTGRG